jgi:ferredoxin
VKARILPGSALPLLIEHLQREYEVIAPFRGRGRDTYFDTVTDANRDRIEVHLPNPSYPPKRYVLPHIETLMRVRQDGAEPQVEPVLSDRKSALFGIRSCDVAGIHHLDRFYLGRAPRDPYYERRRRNLFLANVVCSDARDVGSICFCLCADTGPAARGHFDIQLTDLGGEFLVLAGSALGEAMLAEPFFRSATAEHVERRRILLDDVRRHFRATTSWFPAAVRYVSQGDVLEATWQTIGNRCLECGGCTYVCPACTCFTVSDRQVSPTEIERVRLWDSCALNGFTRMAGGFNPRRAVHDRRNRRFFRKLAHYFIQRELSVACVGCGRCAAVCHGDIRMPSVVEMIRRASLKPAAIEATATRPGS